MTVPIAMTRTLLSLIAAVLFAAPAPALEDEEPKPFKTEELDQLVAPIALHPDAIVSQVLMASTYPLEIVEADRWLKAQSPPLKGDALAKALEEQKWDPSVKSLITFPTILDQMSTQLAWTQKLGDAVLAQEKDVLDSVQSLRKRAKDAGNLKTTEEQTVATEEDVIVIEQTKTEVVYVPVYNPTIVYGTWPYPSYPPTYYYPPHYVYPSAAYVFTVGVIVGVAWGYAWGGCHWHSGNINVNINKNVNFNGNIDRDRYKGGAGDRGKGDWKHNPENRKGVRYRDSKTAERFNKPTQTRSGPAASKTRSSLDAYRGRSSSTDRSSLGGRSSTSTGRTSSSGSASRDRTSRSPSSSSRSRQSSSAFNRYESRSTTSRQSTRGRSSVGSSRASHSRGGGGRSRGGRRGR